MCIAPANFFFSASRRNAAQSSRATIVDVEHGVAAVGEHLHVGLELPLVPVAPRTAMHEHDDRKVKAAVLLRGGVTYPPTGVPSRAGECDRRHRRELVFREPRPRLVQLLESPRRFGIQWFTAIMVGVWQRHDPSRPVSRAVPPPHDSATHSARRLEKPLHVGRLWIEDVPCRRCSGSLAARR